MPRRYTDRWTHEEDQIVIQLRRRGRTVAFISLQLQQRSWYAVHHRIRQFEDDGTLPKMSVPASQRIGWQCNAAEKSYG